MDKVMKRDEVFAAIHEERVYQARKWGPGKEQSLPGYLLIMQSELNEAIAGWMKDKTGRNAPLSEVLQVAAVAVACLEQYGCSGSAKATCDEPLPEREEPPPRMRADWSVPAIGAGEE